MLLNHVVAIANLSWRPVIAMLPSFSFVAKPRQRGISAHRYNSPRDQPGS
jgi:hypothetical protein